MADGDRVMTRDEIVELADAVAADDGIASGIGTTSYGAQLVVDAETGEEAAELAAALLRHAGAKAGLPEWPVSHAEVIGEDDDWGDEG